MSSAEMASWVQSIGSILAIWGAFRVGTLSHRRELERRRHEAAEAKEQTKKLMQRLAQVVWFNLSNLIHIMEESENQAGIGPILQYKMIGQDNAWLHIMESLQSVNVKELSGVQNILVMDLKIACSFALKTCERLETWTIFGNQERFIISQMKYHESRAETAVNVLAGNACD